MEQAAGQSPAELPAECTLASSRSLPQAHEPLIPSMRLEGPLFSSRRLSVRLLRPLPRTEHTSLSSLKAGSELWRFRGLGCVKIGGDHTCKWTWGLRSSIRSLSNEQGQDEQSWFLGPKPLPCAFCASGDGRSSKDTCTRSSCSTSFCLPGSELIRQVPC